MKSDKPNNPRPPGKKSKLIEAAESKVKQLRKKMGLAAAETKSKTESPESAAAVPAAKSPRTRKGTRLNIPPVLLEGDPSPIAAPSGRGERYSLGPTPPSASSPVGQSGLPEGYGTKQLFLTARDPHWLYAHWDLTREQLLKYNGLSVEGHLVLRIYSGAVDGSPLSEIAVHPESKHWFVHVPEAGIKYLADLGYYDSARRWVSLAHSSATLSPPDSLSDDSAVRFATIPSDVPFSLLLDTVKTATRAHLPLVEAIQQMRAQGFTDLPGPQDMNRSWTAAQEQALAEIVSMDQVRRIWIGSLEITELIRRHLQQDISSMSAAQFGWPTSPGETSSVSSAFGGGAPARGFWFNVNAELIIYGSTEPGATVTFGGNPIKLRPDGSFSFRFALPDGSYSLPAAAHSSDGEETREAHLQFVRETAYQGDVGRHPQDENLQPPLVAAVL